MIWRPNSKPDLARMTDELKAFVAQLNPKTNESAHYKEARCPKIAIITPSFNQAGFLERTILSVLNQNYPNLEYMIIDGGSTDGNVEIIKKYEKYLAYWVSEPDKGQAHAINKGLRRATGEWVGFQNSDDLFLPGALETFRKVIMQEKTAELIYGHLVRIDKDDEVTDVQLHMPSPLWMQLAQLHVQNQATLWRRSLLERIGYLRQDMQFCFDNEYFARALKQGAKTGHVDRYLGAFRAQPEAKSSTIPEVSAKETKIILRRYGNILHRNTRIKKMIRLLSKMHKALWCLLHRKGWYLVR